MLSLFYFPKVDHQLWDVETQEFASRGQVGAESKGFR